MRCRPTSFTRLVVVAQNSINQRPSRDRPLSRFALQPCQTSLTAEYPLMLARRCRSCSCAILLLARPAAGSGPTTASQLPDSWLPAKARSAMSVGLQPFSNAAPADRIIVFDALCSTNAVLLRYRNNLLRLMINRVASSKCTSDCAIQFGSIKALRLCSHAHGVHVFILRCTTTQCAPPGQVVKWLSILHVEA